MAALDALLKGGDNESEPMPQSSASGSLDAARDLLSAIAAKDPKALDLALKRHYELCQSEPDEDDTEEG